mmetsp:Transcript_47730/g.54032  ORF Transcript_47730/g.54032 Transcript_47730/m.54032 type:complete len:86 (+) Transcript_47730:234-491(+)
MRISWLRCLQRRWRPPPDASPTGNTACGTIAATEKTARASGPWECANAASNTTAVKVAPSQKLIAAINHIRRWDGNALLTVASLA